VLFDLVKKLYLSIPIGLFLAVLKVQKNRKPRIQTVAVVSLLGVIFEASQIFIRSRVPSLTDVLVVGIGGWIGAIAGRWYQSAKALNEPKASNDSTVNLDK